MASWPQCYPSRPSGSQFGIRTFKGATTFHKGRDQPVGVGDWRLAPAAGVVVDHGQNELHGHWIGVRYDGARNVERQHQVIAGTRLAVGARFTAGTPLAQIGHPHLLLPETLRRRMKDWSGGSKKSSTGQHSHQEIERDRIGGLSIDPAGPEADADWARVIAHQTRPAGSTSKPLTPTTRIPIREDETMIVVVNKSSTGEFPGYVATIAPGYARHIDDPAAAKAAEKRYRVVEVHGDQELGDVFNEHFLSRTAIKRSVGGNTVKS